MKALILSLALILLLGLEDHFPDPKITELNSTVILTANGATFNEILLDFDDEVAALTFEDSVAGTIVIQNAFSFSHSFPIWMDDAITPEIDGYQYNEPIRMHVWRDLEEQEFDETYMNLVQDTSCTLCAKDLLFKPNLLYIFNQIDWSPPLEIEEGEPLPNNPFAFAVESYPSPFRSMVNLQVNMSHHTTVKMTIYNLLGQEVYKEILSVERGKNILQITALVNYPTGLYFFVIDYGLKRLTTSALKVQ